MAGLLPRMKFEGDLQRIATTASRRPALEGKDVYSEVDQALIDREPYYTEVAHFCINTDGISAPAIVGEIIEWLAYMEKLRGTAW